MYKKSLGLFKKILAHPLFGGSMIMLFGSNLANFLSYLYHLILGRILGPSEYSDLVAFLSLIALLGSTYSFLNLVLVKLVASANKKQIEHLLFWFTKIGVRVGIIVALLIGIFSSQFAAYLHSDLRLALIVGPIFAFSLLIFLYRAFLQGMLRFGPLVVTTNVEMALRLVLGLIMILLGLKVFGALIGIMLSMIITWTLTRYFLRRYKFTRGKIENFDKKKLLTYSLPIFIASFANQSLYTSDVVLVKHFFSSFDAGIYGALSNLAKIIFFGTAPIVSVMFPLVAKRHAEGQSYKKIFIISVIMTASISGAILLGYILFPNIAVSLLYGSKYLSASADLAWFGLFIAIYTLDTLFINFYLSRDKNLVVAFVVLAALVQIIGINLFHDSLLTVIKVSILAVTLMLTAFLIYFVRETQTEATKQPR